MNEISPASLVVLSSDRSLKADPDVATFAGWKTGVRDSGVAEICGVLRSGEPAWNTDPLLAASFPSAPAAAMAAPPLVEGEGHPFWQADPE